MASFGMDLDSPLLPNVDSFVNPSKEERDHRSALNAVVLHVHRAGAGAFEGLVTNHMGEYLSNPDAKIRERGTLLLAELLQRLPTLPLASGSASRFAAFFSSRLGDYPSIVPALKALSGLLKNHTPALLGTGAQKVGPEPPAGGGGEGTEASPVLHGGDDGAAAAPESTLGSESAAVVIARSVFDELHLPALAQSIRQAALSVLLLLVSDPALVKVLSTDMGKAFVTGLVGSLEGEKDPRCLIVGLSALRKTQQGFDSAVLEETSEAVFDAVACYFPVTFTPPPNDPHNISPDALRTDLEGVLVGSPGMAPHVVPMLLDKLASEVSTAKEASLKALVASVRSFGAQKVGIHLRAIGSAMFEEAVHSADQDIADLSLLSLTELARETSCHAGLTGLGEACLEWRSLAQPLLERAVAEVAGDQPCSVVGRGSTRVLLALATSSAVGLRSALALAVPRLLHTRKEAAAAAAAMEREVAALASGSVRGCSRDAGGDGASAGGTCCGGGGGGGPHGGGGREEDTGVTPSLAGRSAAEREAFEDAQAARLGALVGLAAAVDDKVDFSGSQGGPPLEPFVDLLLAEFTAALEGCRRRWCGGGGGVEEGVGGGVCQKASRASQSSWEGWKTPSAATEAAAAAAAEAPLSPAVAATSRFAAGGLADVVTRPPVALIPDGEVQGVVRTLTSVLAAPRAWGGRGGEAGIGAGVVDEGTAASAVLTALRCIGLRRPGYARVVLDNALPPLLEQLQQLLLLPDAASCPKDDKRVAAAAGGEGKVKPGPFPSSSSSSPQMPPVKMAAGGDRACAALVELSEIPGVFSIAVSALLAVATSNAVAVHGSDTVARPLLRHIPGSETALRALDAILKRGVKGGRDGTEILDFIRGRTPARPSSVGGAPTAGATEEPSRPSTAVAAKGDGIDPDGDGSGPRGLPLLLAALDSTSSGDGGGTDIVVMSLGDGGEGDHFAGLRLSGGALGAVVSAVRTCTRAAPTEDQEALLSRLLSSVLSPHSSQHSVASSSAHGDDTDEGGIGVGVGGNASARGGAMYLKQSALLPALAAVIGAVDLDSRALGPGGAAVAAVPALLSASLAEGATGLVEGDRGGVRGGGALRSSGGRVDVAAASSSAPCSQCLAAVLNKVAAGPELDSALAVVAGALVKALGGEERGHAAVGEGGDMDVEGTEGDCGGAEPLQCLAWTMKAVVMRGGLGDTFASLLDLLCGQLLAKPLGEDGRPSPHALAAAAAFGIILEANGYALRVDQGDGSRSTDARGGGGGRGIGVRISPLWRQRFFVQAFPKLLAAARGTMATVPGAQTAATTSLPPNSEPGDGDKSRLMERAPALLALLRLVRGVPSETLSQQRDTAVSSVVQGLRSDYPPLQTEALETFEVLAKDDLTAFSQHLSSVIPVLLSVAEQQGGSRGGSGGGESEGGTGASTNRTSSSSTTGSFGGSKQETGGPGGGLSAMDRFRALTCLTSLTALPYSRLHPFKTQVTRRLRGPLDDDRRAVRQAAVESRNIWFLLG